MTRLIDRCDERRGAAIHDRNFGTVDFDDDVIETKTVNRGEHMLGRRYGRTVAVAEHSGKFCRSDRTEIGGKFAISLAVDSGAPEYDAGVGLGRMERNGDG